MNSRFNAVLQCNADCISCIYMNFSPETTLRTSTRATESIELTGNSENLTHIYASKDSATRVSEKVTETASFATSKVFIDEDEETQIKLILKWVLQTEMRADVLDKNEKIRNITTYLEKMKYNGYLRLLDIDLNMIKNYFTPASWALLEQYLKAHGNDKLICPQCKQCFGPADIKWKCERCLFWNHQNCTKPKTIKNGSGANSNLCFSCFFSL